MNDGNVILPINHILKKLESDSLEIDGMVNWDCRTIIEFIFLYTPNLKNVDMDKQAHAVTNRVLTRIGMNTILNTPTPHKIISLIYRNSKEILKIIRDTNLDQFDIQFKTWVGNDVIVRYFRDPEGIMVNNTGEKK